MLLAIPARTVQLATRHSGGLVGVSLVVLVTSLVVYAAVFVAALLGGLLTGLAGGGVEPLALVLLGGAYVVVAYLQMWGFAAGVLVALEGRAVGEALRATRGVALRLLVETVLYLATFVGAALTAPLALVPLAVLGLVPLAVATGAAVAEPGSWGLRTALRTTLLRPGALLVSTLGTLFVVALVVALLGGAAIAGVALVHGTADPRELEVSGTTTAAALAYVAWLVLAQLVSATAWPALVAALYSVLVQGERGGRQRWEWERDEAADDPDYGSRAELSSAAAALIQPPPERRRALSIPPRSPRPGRLPGPGAMRIGGQELPHGGPTRPVQGAGFEVGNLGAGGGAPAAMWVSHDPVPDAARRWKLLASEFAASGLWPVLLPPAGEPPWFELPAVRELPGAGPVRPTGELVRAHLADGLAASSAAPAQRDAIAASAAATGTLTTPTGRTRDALGATFEALEPAAARLALVACTSPADALARIAWDGAEGTGLPLEELVAVLGSWEERYATLLVAARPEELVLAVLRPPTTAAEAIEAAAEHYAVCPEIEAGWGDDRTYALGLRDLPTWRLRWA